MTRAVQPDEGATAEPLWADPGARILVVSEGLAVVSRTVEQLLVEHLTRLRPGARLDVRHDGRNLLRTVTAHPDSLDRYAAIVSLAGPGLLRLSPFGSRIAEQVAGRIPTLLVRTRPEEAGRRLASSRAHGVNTLLLDAALDARSSAGQIAVTLQALLLRRRRMTTSAPGPAPEVRTFDHHEVDELAVRRLSQIVSLARGAFESAAAEVNVIDETHATTVVAAGADAGRTPRGDTLCDITVRSPGLTLISDARSDARSRGRAVVLGVPSVGFYAAYPIRSEDGRLVGTLCIHDPSPQSGDDFDFDLLRDLALLVEGELIESRRRTA